jgi:hypothetical protein
MIPVMDVEYRYLLNFHFKFLSEEILVSSVFTNKYQKAVFHHSLLGSCCTAGVLLKAPRSSGVNGAKFCILALS